MVSTENAVAGLPNYAELKTQFDHVWDGYERVPATQKIEACAEFAELKCLPQASTHGNSNVEASELVISPGHQIRLQSALTEIDLKGMRPATLEELLAYAKKFPRRQLECPIIALGTVLMTIDGFLFAPFIDGHEDIRGLFAHDLGEDFYGINFLVVPK